MRRPRHRRAQEIEGLRRRTGSQKPSQRPGGCQQEDVRGRRQADTTRVDMGGGLSSIEGGCPTPERSSSGTRSISRAARMTTGTRHGSGRSSASTWTSRPRRDLHTVDQRIPVGSDTKQNPSFQSEDIPRRQRYIRIKHPWSTPSSSPAVVKTSRQPERAGWHVRRGMAPLRWTPNDVRPRSPSILSARFDGIENTTIDLNLRQDVRGDVRARDLWRTRTPIPISTRILSRSTASPAFRGCPAPDRGLRDVSKQEHREQLRHRRKPLL